MLLHRQLVALELMLLISLLFLPIYVPPHPSQRTHQLHIIYPAETLQHPRAPQPRPAKQEQGQEQGQGQEKRQGRYATF
jgi:hypothetical protein